MCPYQTIIKLSQTVWELWPAQDFGMRGDKYKMEKVTVLLNTTCLLVPYLWLYQILSKYFKPHTQGFTLKFIQGRSLENNHGRCCLSCTWHAYCSIPMPLPNIIKITKGIKVMERTRFWLQGMKKKLRVVSLAYDMPTGPPLHLYLISQYYLKQYGSYGLHKISASGETTT